MSSTSPTPDGASGQTPAPKPHPPTPVPPEPQAASLNELTPPTQTDPQQEPVRTTHRIMGQRLVIDYEIEQLGDREALTTAKMRLLPPFGSSCTLSTPYTIKPAPGNPKAEPSLIELLHGLRDSKEPPKDREIIRQLRRALDDLREIEILCESIKSARLRKEIPPMTFFAPYFHHLARELELFEARYLSSRGQNGIYQECTCHIDLKGNAVWARFQEADGVPHLKELEVIGVSKDLPSNLSGLRAVQIAWRNLTGIAEGAMKTFQTYGARCAMSALKTSLPYGKPPNHEKMPVDHDERLRLGVVRDFAPDTVIKLPTGGTAILDVGDQVAALCISATDHEDCSTCCFVYDSKQSKYLGQNWHAHLDEIRSLMQKILDGSPLRHAFILEELAKHAVHVFDRRCSISHIVGDQAARTLAALEEAGSLKAWLPNTACIRDGRLVVLRGYEQVELTLAQVPGVQENLASFSSAKLFVGATGTIEIHLENQLRNRITVALSERAVTDWGGVGKVVTSLAFALSTRDIPQAHARVHQLVEKMARPSLSQSDKPEIGIIEHQGIPSNNELERRTFAVALGIVHAAHSASNCYGNHAVQMAGPSRAVAVIQLVSAPYTIEFAVEDECIREVVLRGEPHYSSQYDHMHTPPTLRFAIPPAAVPLLVQALPEVFADYYQYGGPRGYCSKQADALQRTKIFQFLTTHARPISGGQRSAREED